MGYSDIKEVGGMVHKTNKRSGWNGTKRYWTMSVSFTFLNFKKHPECIISNLLFILLEPVIAIGSVSQKPVMDIGKNYQKH